MDCRHIRRVIPALLDHELPSEEAARIRAHLDSCPQCRTMYEAFQQDQEILHTFLWTAPWLPVAERVRAQLPTHSRRARWRQRATLASRLTASIALVVLLLLVGAGAAALTRERDRPQTLAQPSPISLTVSVSPRMAFVERDETIRVIDLQTERVIRTIPPVPGVLRHVYLPDGSRLYVAYETPESGEGHLDIYDITTGRRIAGTGGLRLEGEDTLSHDIVASSDGRTVYIHGRRVVSVPGAPGRDECWVSVFDTTANRLEPATILLPTCTDTPFVLSADGRTLYSNDQIIDLTTQPPTLRENPDLATAAVVQSSDGRRIYALNDGGDIAVWDANTRTIVRQMSGVVPAYGSFIYRLSGFALSEDGSRLFIATNEGDASHQKFMKIVAVDSMTGRQIASLSIDRPTETFPSFVASADGSALYFTTFEATGTLVQWNVATGATRATSLTTIVNATPIPPPTTPSQSPTAIPTGDSTQTFSDAALNAKVRFPTSWYQRYNSDIISFESTNGQNPLGYAFLSLAGLDGTSLDTVCRDTANESYHPYGTTPRIEQWAVQGQPACLIFPSADQQDPHGGFAALIVQAPQPFRFPASPAHTYLNLRVDMLHFRTVAQTLRFLQFPVAKADIVWNTVALDARGLLEVWKPGVTPSDFVTVQGAQGVVGGQHNSYQVDYDGPGKRLSIGIGPFVPPPGTSQPVTVHGHQGTLTTTADGQLALTWNDIAAPNDPTAVSHYVSFVTAEGIPADEVQSVADSLYPMQQPPAPSLLSHEQPGLQPLAGTDVDTALSTFKEFMEARIARDPQRAFDYLNGDTRTIDYATMLPADTSQWAGYQIVTADRAPDGSVHIRVGVAERDTTTASLHTIMKEQTATLQQQGDHWIITALSPLATVSETNAATPPLAGYATSTSPITTGRR